MRFTRDHEWVNLADDGTATVGISKYAADQLGDVVFVEVPQVGKAITKGEGFAVVESVKAASDVYAPVAGRVVEANARLADDPGLVNRDPMGEGWFYRLELSDPGQLDALMDEAGYRRFVESQA